MSPSVQLVRYSFYILEIGVSYDGAVFTQTTLTVGLLLFLRMGPLFPFSIFVLLAAMLVCIQGL